MNEHQQLDTLLDALLEGDITPEQHDELARMIETDEDAAQRYLDVMSVHAVLSWKNRWMYQPAFEATRSTGSTRSVDEAAPQRPLSLRFVGGAIAAALVVAVTLGVVFLSSNPVSESLGIRDRSVATLTTTNDAEWDNLTTDMEIGVGVPVGPLELTGGSAQLLFDSGAVVDLSGPARFEITGDNAAALTRGVASVHVPESAHGFTIDTPNGVRVIDRGTEFTVKASEIGGTDVYVLDGYVELHTPDQHTYRIDAGEGARVGVRGAVSRIKTYNGDWLGEALTDRHETRRESFSDGALPAGFEEVDPSQTEYVDGRVRFKAPADAQRCYLRTTRTDYTARSFVAEVTVTVGESGGIGGGFLGVGLGEPAPGAAREPGIGPSVFAVVWPDDFRAGKELHYGDFNVGDPQATGHKLDGSEGAGGWGTHRLRLSFNAATQQAVFAIDRDYQIGDRFAADFVSETIDVADNGFDATNARVFIGGGRNVTFDDLTIREYDLRLPGSVVQEVDTATDSQ